MDAFPLLRMPAAISSVRRRRLVRELQIAYHLLQAWETSLAAATDDTVGGSRDLSGEEAALLAMVKDARLSIQRRLHELGMGTEPLEAPSGIGPRLWALSGGMLRAAPQAAAKPGLHLNACRACGHALGAVFREAQTVADEATAHLVYRWVRAFEKHLWVLDPGQAGRTFPLQLTGPTR